MSQRDALAPSFIEGALYGMLGSRLEDRLTSVAQNYLDTFNIDIPLPMPVLRRTLPEFWPENDTTLVLYGYRTTIQPQRRPAQGLLQERSILPGEGAEYGTSLRVSVFCRGGEPVGNLSEAEVLNIRCKNIVWAAFLAVIDIAMETDYIMEIEGMAFANTRGESFPLTEQGYFGFTVFVS